VFAPTVEEQLAALRAAAQDCGAPRPALGGEAEALAAAAELRRRAEVLEYIRNRLALFAARSAAK
jgi:hypothetical protein